MPLNPAWCKWPASRTPVDWCRPCFSSAASTLTCSFKALPFRSHLVNDSTLVSLHPKDQLAEESTEVFVNPLYRRSPGVAAERSPPHGFPYTNCTCHFWLVRSVMVVGICGLLCLARLHRVDSQHWLEQPSSWLQNQVECFCAANYDIHNVRFCPTS